MCGSKADMKSAMAEIREEKRKIDRRRNHRAKI